jgi:hypothetical protein
VSFFQTTTYYNFEQDKQLSARTEAMAKILRDMEPKLKTRIKHARITWAEVEGGLSVPELNLEFYEAK